MKRFIILIGLMATLLAFGQKDPMFTHYMYNTLSVNPAYAGSREALTLTLLHRNQWVTFPGAPKTTTLSLHTPIFSQNLALGLSLSDDKIGDERFTSFFADFAIGIKLSKKSKLTFGLKAGADLYNANYSNFDTDDPNDPIFQYNYDNKILPNFGFGLYYTFNNRFYAGFSTPRLLKHDFVGDKTVISSNIPTAHYYLICGAAIPVSKFVEFKPSTLLKMTAGAPLQLDITTQFEFYNKFNIGLMYRTNDALGVLVGIYIYKNLLLGYSYDFSFANTSAKYNQGSHELMLRYDLTFSSLHRIKSPRFF